MVKIVCESRSGRIIEREGDVGTVMFELLGDFDVWGQCGGCCACATCHCIVLEGAEHLPPAHEDEVGLLDMEPNATENSRLACQINLDELPKDAIIKIKVPHCD